jgi:hypothetical protein
MLCRVSFRLRIASHTLKSSIGYCIDSVPMCGPLSMPDG